MRRLGRRQEFGVGMGAVLLSLAYGCGTDAGGLTDLSESDADLTTPVERYAQSQGIAVENFESADTQKALVEGLVMPSPKSDVLLGDVAVLPVPTEEPPALHVTVEGSGQTEDVGSSEMQMISANVETGEVRLLTYELNDLAGLSEAMHQRGLDGASPIPGDEVEPVDLDLPEQDLAGWSAPSPNYGDGDDDRELRGVAQGYGWGHSTYKRIVRLQAARDCTGTMIGRRLVLTAAHCVINVNGDFVGATVRPRSDPKNFDAMDPNPYGSEDSVQIFAPPFYTASFCHSFYSESCVAQDWAIVVLPDDAWEGSGQTGPSWMGYQYVSEADTKARSIYGAGYPACSAAGVAFVDRPKSSGTCYSNVLWAQAGQCKVNHFAYSTDGFNYVYRDTCDVSPGDSGAPRYWISEGGSRYVMGVYDASLCTTCTTADVSDQAIRQRPNLIYRIGPNTKTIIDAYRASFP